MKRPFALSAALFAAAVFTVPLLPAAEADDDDDKPAATGRIKDIGSRKATPDVAPASEEAAQAIKRM